MGRQNRRKPISLKNIEIIDTADKGKSVAKHEGRAIFVQGGVPGDICDITVFKRRKKYWEARIEKIHEYSKRRKEPPIASCLSRSSQSSHGGVEQNYETPHTSFSIWVLLDEGTFFMCLPNNELCVKIPSVRS